MAQISSSGSSRAVLYSALFHAFVLLVAIFGMPEAWKKHRESLPTVMTVQILPVGQTNVKSQEAVKPKKKTKQPKKVKPKPKKIKKPKPKSYTEERKPTPKLEPLPLPKKEKKKAEVKPKVEPKPKKEKPKKKPMDLDAILKSVKEAANEQDDNKKKTDNAQEVKRAVSDSYNNALPMEMSEVDAIRQQFISCWNIPAGAKNAHNLSIVLDINLTRTGKVITVELAKSRARYYSDSFFRAATDSAIRAVRRCSPVRNLPANKYESWKYIQLNFDPKDLLY